MNGSRTSERRTLPALTGLRFLPALVVVFSHYAPTNLGSIASAPLAVRLFFMLSGFIMLYTSWGQTRSVWQFYVARFARIYPAYVLSLGLCAVLILSGHVGRACPADPRQALLPSALLMQSWLPQGGLPCLNGPSWSLSVEIFFYLVFPVLLPLVARIPANRVIAACAVCWLTAFIIPLTLPTVTSLSVTSNLSLFVGGMLVGRLYLLGYAGKIPLRRTMLAVAVVSFFPLSTLASWHGTPPTLQFALSWPSFAIIILLLAESRSMLTTPIFAALGEASYSLYILHVPIADTLAACGLYRSGWAFFAPYLLLVVCLSVVVCSYIEQPARRAIRAVAAAPFGPAVRRSRPSAHALDAEGRHRTSA